MSTDNGRLVPVLCSIQTFTEASVVLQTFREEDSPLGLLTFSVAMNLATIQTIDAWATRCSTASDLMKASEMTGPQQAEAMLSDVAVVWIPQWKVDAIGVTTMEPKTPETQE